MCWCSAVAVVALGLFRGDRFSYARALYSPRAPTSVVCERVAEELGCVERLERRFEMVIEGVGSVEILGVCAVDRAIIDGQLVEVPVAIHVAKMPMGSEFDAVIGRDLDLAWRLYLDPLTNSVRSLVARPIERRY